jgi:hypothetical protein
MIAIVAFVLIKVGLMAGIFAAPASANFSRVVVSAAAGDADFVATILSVFLMLNVILGTFNLLPLPPLDGGRCSASSCPRIWAGGCATCSATAASRSSACWWRGGVPVSHGPDLHDGAEAGAPRLVLPVIDPFFKQWASRDRCRPARCSRPRCPMTSRSTPSAVTSASSN